MENTTYKTVKSGKAYDHLFPPVTGNNILKNKDAGVKDTLDLIHWVVQNTLADTVLIAPLLKGKTLYETCENIWNFVYDHIRYEMDESGIEQVRRPARLWADRIGDCDCYTVFISSVLTNLRIPHVYRITKNTKPHFQHIYPIVPTGNGKYITIDCVVPEFNYEAPYTEKKDSPMKLEFLNGLDDKVFPNQSFNMDAPDMSGFDEPELGLLKFLKKNTSTGGEKKGTKVGNIIKTGLHVINRVNPATGLLRVGLLASMKINLFKVAGHLRYAYLTDQQAKEKGLDLNKFQQLKKVLYKLEEIFYSAGGKRENIRKAIMKGKGNRDKQFSGFDGLSYAPDMPVQYFLADVAEPEQLNGLGELGEVVTASAAIAQALAAMKILQELIQKIGALKSNGQNVDAGVEGNANEIQNFDSNAEDVPYTDTAIDTTVTTAARTDENTQQAVRYKADTSVVAKNDSASSTPSANTNVVTSDTSSATSVTDTSNSNTSTNTNTSEQSFADKAKEWVKENPVTTGLAVVGVTSAIAFIIYKYKNKNKQGLSGVSGAYQKKRRKKKSKGKSGKKRLTHIALL